ncbi:MAG: DUF1273 domain-containing protein [Clostridiales bacterium]|jgi:uncharacterized phage-like protein YoqJ|nr:DUF1273 domain-containing protein [Clostridiales bacterium]
MKENTCCFTGHRRIPKKMVERINSRLYVELLNAITKGKTTFCVGGAVGFDTLVAKMVLELKQAFSHIRLHLILPCKMQYIDWTEKQKEEYKEILESADSVEYVSEEYTSGCMHIRNRRLVDESSLCICYLTSLSGGTAYTVNYAKKSEIEIINLADWMI